jgi:hypothetical protein
VEGSWGGVSHGGGLGLVRSANHPQGRLAVVALGGGGWKHDACEDVLILSGDQL